MSQQETVEQLLEEFINRMDITWATDETVKAKLRGIVERCMDGLSVISGNPQLQFTGWVKSLLLDYCRYDYNNCRETFEAAFVTELTRLRLMEGFACGKEAPADL